MTDNITFTYDGYGRRVGIVESHGSTVLTSKTFVWCYKVLCEERDATGHTVTKQFYDRGEQISGTNYYYTKDHLGSIREMTDSSGTIQASYDYNPWGRQIVLNQAVTTDFGYTGFYVNKTTGLDLTWYRIYDPEKGRWLSRDPLGEYVKFDLSLPTGPDLYAYAKDNPTRWTDRLGLDCSSDCQSAYNKDVNNCISNAESVGGLAFVICATLLQAELDPILGIPLCLMVAQRAGEQYEDNCKKNAYLTLLNCNSNCKNKCNK